MGVDAEILVRIKGRDRWITDEGCVELAYQLASSFGHERFAIRRADEQRNDTKPRHALNIVQPFVDVYGDAPHLVGKVIHLQDPDPLVAADGEQFLHVNLITRYYGIGYERGDWPFLRMLFAWLGVHIPQGQVWYGGDIGSGVAAEHMTPTKIAHVDDHFFRHGRRPYVHSRVVGWARTTAPVCDLCRVQLASCGGGPGYDFWGCDGCGKKISKHSDGREVMPASPKHGFPYFDKNGRVVQRSE